MQEAVSAHDPLCACPRTGSAHAGRYAEPPHMRDPYLLVSSACGHRVGHCRQTQLRDATQVCRRRPPLHRLAYGRSAKGEATTVAADAKREQARAWWLDAQPKRELMARVRRQAATPESWLLPGIGRHARAVVGPSEALRVGSGGDCPASGATRRVDGPSISETLHASSNGTPAAVEGRVGCRRAPGIDSRVLCDTSRAASRGASLAATSRLASAIKRRTWKTKMHSGGKGA
eukprot:scaffold187486_cov28-Tisochrysis_lutea.AAC.2